MEKHGRFLIFAWNLGDEDVNDNPLSKIIESVDTNDEVNKAIREHSDFDFISVFDCDERETIMELDNIPF